VSCCGDAREGRSADKPILEVAEIFRVYGEEYRRTHALSPEQLRVMGDHCGHKVPSYNSCSDRHCPKCQALRQAKWIAQRKERLLPTHYFHLVFTLPAELRSLAMCNRKAVFDMLFHAAAETLLELGDDEKHLGGLLGITAVLHTWTRKLEFHPHVHCVVTGGGLDVDGDRWTSSKPDFLFPVRVLSRLFRGKFLHALSRAHTRENLVFKGGCAKLEDPQQFAALKSKLYGKEWVVYAKPPFGGPEAVFEYLGRYTHRVAISNQRLISMDLTGITFFTKDGGTATLEPTEFIRRFLMHVLPGGYTKIRHFGLLSSCNVNTKLQRAKKLLGSDRDDESESTNSDETSSGSWLEQLLPLDDKPPSVCPCCGIGKMRRHHIKPAFYALSGAHRRDTS
jgi:hypothetical protein